MTIEESLLAYVEAADRYSAAVTSALESVGTDLMRLEQKYRRLEGGLEALANRIEALTRANASAHLQAVQQGSVPKDLNE